MKILIFHADIQYVVRMKKKLKQKQQKSEQETHIHKWICLFANKIPFSSFHCLFVLILLLLSTSLSTLHVHYPQDTGDFSLLLLPCTAKMLVMSKLQVFFAHWYHKDNFIMKLILWPFDFQQIKDDKVDSRIPSAHVLSLVRGAKNKS